MGQLAVCGTCGKIAKKDYGETSTTLEHIEDFGGAVSHLVHITDRGRDIVIANPELK